MSAAEPEDGRADGGRVSLSLDGIAQAAIRLADAGGMDAVSMRKVAAELGSGTMSLYRHVAGKERLYALMCDTVMGAADLPPRTGDWRTDLRGLAEAERALYRRHPWMLDSVSPVGANTLRWLEYALTVLGGTGLDMDDMMRVLNVAAGTVHASVRRELGEARLRRETGLGVREWHESHSEGLAPLLQSGEYPMFTRMVAQAREGDHDDSFERSLDIVLDGVAALVARAEPGTDDSGRGPAPRSSGSGEHGDAPRQDGYRGGGRLPATPRTVQ